MSGSEGLHVITPLVVGVLEGRPPSSQSSLLLPQVLSCLCNRLSLLRQCAVDTPGGGKRTLNTKVLTYKRPYLSLEKQYIVTMKTVTSAQHPCPTSL